MKSIALSLLLIMNSSLSVPVDLFIERYIQEYQRINANRISPSIIYVPRIDNLVFAASIETEIYSPQHTIDQRRHLVLEKIFDENVIIRDCQYAINISAGLFYEYSITLSGNAGRSVWIDRTGADKRISALLAFLHNSPPDYIFTVNRFEQYNYYPFWIIVDDGVFVLLYDEGKSEYYKVDAESFIMRIAPDEFFYSFEDFLNN